MGRMETVRVGSSGWLPGIWGAVLTLALTMSTGRLSGCCRHHWPLKLFGPAVCNLSAMPFPELLSNTDKSGLAVLLGYMSTETFKALL
jgi:hypothetical protein